MDANSKQFWPSDAQPFIASRCISTHSGMLFMCLHLRYEKTKTTERKTTVIDRIMVIHRKNSREPKRSVFSYSAKGHGQKTNDKRPKDQGPRTKDQRPKTKDQSPKINDQRPNTKRANGNDVYTFCFALHSKRRPPANESQSTN